MIVNSTVTRGFAYRTAADRFHQWRFNNETFGLHFGTIEEANNFSNWIQKAISAAEAQSPDQSETSIKARVFHAVEKFNIDAVFRRVGAFVQMFPLNHHRIASKRLGFFKDLRLISMFFFKY